MRRCRGAEMTDGRTKPVRGLVDCRDCRARIDGLCTGASSELLQFISTYKSGDRRIRAGQDLFTLGEPCEDVYNLVDGWAFLYSTLDHGRRQILNFALPGAVMGFLPLGRGNATHGVQALTDVVVCVIPRNAFDRLLKDQANVGMRLAWLMSRDRSLSFDRLTSVGIHAARQRVAHLLLELFIRCRSQWPGRWPQEMLLPLTQEHIADATGLTFVHVNRVLRDLRRNGIAEFHYRRLRILDPDRLVEVAGVDPQLALSWIRVPTAQAPSARAAAESVDLRYPSEPRAVGGRRGSAGG